MDRSSESPQSFPESKLGPAEALAQYANLEQGFHNIIVGTEAPDGIPEKVSRLNTIYESEVWETNNTQLIHADARVFSAALGAMNSHSNPIPSNFLRVLNADQLEESIRRKIDAYGENGLDELLEKSCLEFPTYQATPIVLARSFGLPQVRERAQREKKVRIAGPAQQTIAFDYEKQQNDEEIAIKSIRAHLKQVYLTDREPLNYYQFVLNRSSFTQTVENVFYLSFLIRDNYVLISQGAEVMDTTIRPLFRRPGMDSGSVEEEQEDEDSYYADGLPDEDYLSRSSGPQNLFLAEMDYDFWMELRSKYPDGGIPSRRDNDESEYTKL